MPARLGVVAREDVTAAAAGRRPEGVDVVRWQQRSSLQRVPGLAAAAAAGRGPGRGALAGGGIGRGWPGGVAGVPAQPLFQLADALFQSGDPLFVPVENLAKG